MAEVSSVKIIAKAYLVDDSGSYVPGSEIRAGGEIYRQREYYASLGQVEIVQSAAEPGELKPDADTDSVPVGEAKSAKGKTAKGS